MWHGMEFERKQDTSLVNREEVKRKTNQVTLNQKRAITEVKHCAKANKGIK